MQITITHRGESRTVEEAGWQAALDEMVARLGAWDPATSKVDKVIEPGEINPEAQARIQAQHDKLNAAGYAVGRDKQFFDTGTQMLTEGYENQRSRQAEHQRKLPVQEAAHAMIRQIRAEQRQDVDVSCGDLLDVMAMNGKLTVQGYAMGEQAIRGLLGRIESPALRYVMGLRDRIAKAKRLIEEPEEEPEHSPTELRGFIAADKSALLDVMQRELRRHADVPIKLRLRDGLKDCYAVVSPSYGVADAPQVLAEVVDALPKDAKGSYSYDPTTTSWELRASIWTPTPVAKQAVGEPFEGYAAYRSRDNGTGGLGGGGGIVCIRCWNATVYVVEDGFAYRIHRANVMDDLSKLTAQALKAIDTLADAWGTARADAVDCRIFDAEKHLIPIEEAIPGFYRHMLTARRGELVGVLPGRTDKHAAGLKAMYFDQRRNETTVVRADLAQGWTRYIQDQPTPVRREAEAAIANWMIRQEPVRYLEA